MPINVLVVDDSAFMRKVITEILESDPRFKVVATARDGEVALQRVREHPVDLITLDIEMPRMDGLTFLEKLMAEKPLPVLMISALTQRGSRATLEALDRGAVDFVAKPSAPGQSMESIRDELLRKARAAARARVRPILPPPAASRPAETPATTASQPSGGVSRPSEPESPSFPAAGQPSTPSSRSSARSFPLPRSALRSPLWRTARPSGAATPSVRVRPSFSSSRDRPGVTGSLAADGVPVSGPLNTAAGAVTGPAAGAAAGKPAKVPIGGPPRVVVAIGASTGGPRAVEQVLCGLPDDLPVTIMITQHMPPGFTASYANRLDERCHFHVKEARDNDRLLEGMVFIAPGGYHMTVDRGGRIRLNQDPPVCYVRPSADVMMKSIAAVYGPNVVGVVLTGMGRDGAQGMKAIAEAGGRTLVQDEATSVIFSMPAAVIAGGYADEVVPLPEMSSRIAHHCRELYGRSEGGPVNNKEDVTVDSTE